MAYYLRRFKKTNECDGAGCDAPMSTPPDGMGDAIPCVSGDRWDNVFGVGWNLVNTPKKKKYHARKRRKK
jgi:hypothetical protein